MKPEDPGRMGQPELHEKNFHILHQQQYHQPACNEQAKSSMYTFLLLDIPSTHHPHPSPLLPPPNNLLANHTQPHLILTSSTPPDSAEPDTPPSVHPPTLRDPQQPLREIPHKQPRNRPLRAVPQQPHPAVCQRDAVLRRGGGPICPALASRIRGVQVRQGPGGGFLMERARWDC